MRDDVSATSLFVGVMSGTSLDGVDVAVIDFADEKKPVLVCGETYSLPQRMADLVREVSVARQCSIDALMQADVELARFFAESVLSLLEGQHIDVGRIKAIGSHGQTVFHAPSGDLPFTLQVGDPNVISSMTGMITVADFRRKDVALGGQGAPLVSGFQAYCFSKLGQARVMLNIGGFANMTVLLGKPEDVVAFDSGPGNVLLNGWCEKHCQQPYDQHGEWASQGQVIDSLLERLMADPYFRQPVPKSTGREYFNMDWLGQVLAQFDGAFDACDVQATLAQLTADTIAQGVLRYAEHGEVFVHGGGWHNLDLMRRLKLTLPEFQFESTEVLGVPGDYFEAAAFAWMAKRTLDGMPSSVAGATGASRDAVLGGVFYP